MKKLALISVVGLILTGCGGSDSNSNGSNDNNTQAPSAIQGTIDSDPKPGNTVIVNGYSYNVDSVHYKDQDLDISDLKKNMMVSISSNARSTNDAVQLTLEPTIVGQISDINLDSDTFRVNGVELTFSSLSPQISDQDWVMVSSLPTANAGYKVLSVVKFEPSDEYETVEVEGVITNLNLNTLTFNLGGALNVEYTVDSIDNDSNESELADGLWVEVTGSMVGSVLKADDVEVEDFDEIDNDTEIEGIITWVANDKSSFDLSYKGRFLVNDNTRYEDGNQSNLTIGTEVEVTTKQANGENVATEIEFEFEFEHDDDSQDWNDNDVDFEGTVQDINLEGNNFEMTSLHGNKIIHVNKNTQFEDGLTFENLTIGDLIDVEAYKVNSQYIAIEIEAEDND